MINTIVAEEKSTRIFFLDELRGLMIISMIFYHLVYDLAVIFDVQISWLFSTASNFWQGTICCTFIFISGACCLYSKNNYKRGLKLLLLACGFSLVTWLLAPDLFIAFGLLHFLAVSVLIFPFIRRFLEKIPIKIGLTVSIIFFILTYQTSSGRFGVGEFSVLLPRFLYSTQFLFPLGFCQVDFFSSDYFPLFPYFFIFLAGAFAARIRFSAWFYKRHCVWLGFIGKQSLWIYLFHQPVIIGILWVVMFFLHRI